MADDRPDGARIDTTPTTPKPPANLIEAACRKIPEVMADVAPNHAGVIELVGAQLVARLQKAEHLLAAAQWAVHESVGCGHLTVSPAVFVMPERIVTEGERTRNEVFPPGWKPFPQSGDMATAGDSNAPNFHAFKVAATPELWSYWNSTTIGGGGSKSLGGNGLRNDQPAEHAFSHNSDFFFDAFRDAIQAMKGFLWDRIHGKPSRWPVEDFVCACRVTASQRAELERYAEKPNGWLNQLLEDLQRADLVYGEEECYAHMRKLHEYEITLFRARTQSHADPVGRSNSEALRGQQDTPSDLPATSKASTAKGEGRAKLIAVLTEHHRYADGGCLNQEPIGNNELARRAKVAKRTASEFFADKFGSHAKYRKQCGNLQLLVAALKALNGEFLPSDFANARLPDDFDAADER